MNQFVTTQNTFGDMNIENGAIIDIRGHNTAVFQIAPGTTDAIADTPGTSAIRAAPRFAGGSSRNLLITQTGTDIVPGGWMAQTALNEWKSEDGPFTVRISSAGKVEWFDGYDVVMTAPAGSIPIANRYSCSTLAASGGPGGGEFIVDLGTATGLVTLDFNAQWVPDIFKVEYNGVEVINTGYRGEDGTYDGVEVVVEGSGNGSASFTKSTTTPTFCKVTVVAPFSGTAWSFNCGCPNGADPPYSTPVSGRTTFTATSTAYGQAENSGIAFTRPVTFEGGELKARIQVVAESIGMDEMTMVEANVTRWYDLDFSVQINSDGTSSFSDTGGIIAIRANENQIDPSGSYESTAYGRDKFNNGFDFAVSVSMIISSPIQLWTYLQIEISGNLVTGVKGPYSAPTMPANSSHLKHIPISYSDGNGRVTQYFEGTLLFK